MLTKGDDYPLHQTAEPIAYSGTDRNFYDRYFFNGYNRKGDMFFAAALGVYPHLNIMDGAFCVVLDGVQHNLHVSRHLRMERMDTRVGPVGVVVVEPLQKLRLEVNDPEHGIHAEILFEGRSRVIEEPRFVRRIGPRSFMDYTRMTQAGTYSGWLEVSGKRVDITGCLGTRDRSWGVRPVGLSDPQPMEPPMLHQFHWIWSCLNFDQGHALYMLNADEDGEPWNSGAVIGGLGDSEEEHMRSSWCKLSIPSSTRHAKSAELGFVHRNGDETRLELSVQWNFYMFGLGYLHPEWGHGHNKGALAVGYDSFRTADIQTFAPPYIHVQAFVLARMQHPDGRVSKGSGVLEQLLLGPYKPLGLTGVLDPIK